MTMEDIRNAKAAKYALALIKRGEQTVFVAGYKIQPAIGRTGRSENVGWELIPLEIEGPTWYLATKDQCIKNIPRHAQRYKR